ncbi:hypothetical protein MKK64_23745 [Methylobacterium sp. E-025]|uniref:hypothetical protein n=1 Tax=Methylobacterium sp. E-025 TaxID=2836561 RepID=UPI001FBB9ECE|nr:hypothetical protein [Methylobacterium sp. E-025]MCJ2114186.1 hypothetical protein [Methylobacterium sp. E-025]
MRSAFAILLVLITTAAAAGDGPWSAPQWHLGASETKGQFAITTSMFVRHRPGTSYDDVEVSCSVQNLTNPSDHSMVRRMALASPAQDLWCGDAGPLGEWCVRQEEGATLTWYGRTPCAGGAAEFSTGD